MLRQRSDNVRNLVLALAVTILSGVLVDAGCSRGEGRCGITCTGVNQGLATLIREQYHQMQEACPILDSLKVEVSTFPEQTLKSGWMPADVPLNGSLTFSDCDFSSIDNDAFEGEHFHKVISLYLFDLTKLRSLRRDHFRSLKNLDKLEMRQLVSIEHIEDGLLNDNVKLSTLQFSNGVQNSITRFLANITGNDNELPNLQTVDFSYNNLGALEPVFFTSFAKSQLAQLYLNNANVTDISEYTFNTTSNFAKLQLSANHLTNLTEHFYGNNSMRSDAIFYLEGNPWQCSCYLVWMINKTFIEDDPTCVVPGTAHQINIKNATRDEMCVDNGQTTASTTTPATVTVPITSETTPITTSSTDLTTETTPAETTTTDTATTTETTTTDTATTTTETTTTDTATTTTETTTTDTATTTETTTTDTATTTETATTDTATTTETTTTETTKTTETATTETTTTTETTIIETTVDSTTATTTETTTTETTTETITVTTMTPSDGDLLEECIDGGSFSEIDDPNCDFKGGESGTLIQMVECGDKVHVQINNRIHDVDLVVWSNTTQSYNGTCLRYNSTSSNITTSFYVTGLSASESFIVCAASSRYGINIANCGAYTMQPVEAQRPWLTNGDKGSYIPAAVMIVLAIFVVSGLIIGLVVKLRPSLIVRNMENVQFKGLDGKPCTETIVLPPDYRKRTNNEDMQDTTPQENLTTNDGHQASSLERDHVAVDIDDLPPEPSPRRIAVVSNVVISSEPPRPSQLSENSTISYISLHTPTSSAASSPRVSDASSASYLTILGSALTGTIRSVTSIRISISSRSSISSRGSISESNYERRGSDIPYEHLPTATSQNHTDDAHNHNKTLSRLRDKVTAFAKHKDKFKVMQEIPSPSGSLRASSSRSDAKKLRLAFEIPPAADISCVDPPPSAQSETDTSMLTAPCRRAENADMRYTRKENSSATLRTLKRNRVSRNVSLKAQDLVQRQLHMFNYTVFEDVAENDVAEECVVGADPSPVTLRIRRELVLGNINSAPDDPETVPRRRRGLILPLVEDDLLTEVVDVDDEATVEESGRLEFVDDGLTLSPTTSELRRNLEDSLQLEALEKGGTQNADVEEPALYRPSGIWNHVPHTWSTTVPKICLERDFDDASGA